MIQRISNIYILLLKHGGKIEKLTRYPLGRYMIEIVTEEKVDPVKVKRVTKLSKQPIKHKQIERIKLFPVETKMNHNVKQMYIKVLKGGYKARQSDTQLYAGQVSINNVYNLTLKKKKKAVVYISLMPFDWDQE